MNNSDLSAKQVEILKYIEEVILSKSYPPSVREICKAVSLSSPASVQAHLNVLEERGYIKRDASKQRALEVTDPDFLATRVESVSLPLVGDIAAGEPILADQRIAEYFPLPSSYIPKTTNSIYMLKVHGESMINAGIYDGDLLIVESAKSAKNGDIVVALLDDSATVKRFYKENGHYRLQPENDTMEPIIVPNVEICGIVKALFRPTVG